MRPSAATFFSNVARRTKSLPTPGLISIQLDESTDDAFSSQLVALRDISILPKEEFIFCSALKRYISKPHITTNTSLLKPQISFYNYLFFECNNFFQANLCSVCSYSATLYDRIKARFSNTLKRSCS